MHETHRLPWDGAVDADGHILEPSDLWERYIDPKHRHAALRIVKDDKGLDELEIGGKRSQMARSGMPSTLAAMGRPDLAEMMRDPEVTYDNHASPAVTASDGVRTQFTTLFDHAVFDKFPRLKVLVLESGGGWIGYWLDRMDAVYSHTMIGARSPLQHPPSHYFREQCWISCDPDERTIPHLAERFGVSRFMWASDFPHADHTADYIHDLDELASMFPEADRRRFLGDNTRELFKIGV